jgi:hypothetical protein
VGKTTVQGQPKYFLKKKYKREKQLWLSPRQTRDCASPSLYQNFPDCYVQLKAVLGSVIELYVHRMALAVI